LKSLFSAIAPDTSLDNNILLTALRDDASYGLDPLKLQVTLIAAQQFAQITQDSPAFRVLAAHRFEVKAVEVNLDKHSEVKA